MQFLVNIGTETSEKLWLYRADRSIMASNLHITGTRSRANVFIAVLSPGNFKHQPTSLLVRLMSQRPLSGTIARAIFMGFGPHPFRRSSPEEKERGFIMLHAF